MNILSFDIEEWYVMQKNFPATANLAQYDKILAELLDALAELEIKATFFCVGQMAKEHSHIIKKIKESGHEIGCHSHNHIWLNKLTRSEVEEDTRVAIDALQQCIGEKITSYRAPAFSIGESNKWVFELLAKNGITKDSSIFPAARDFGGFPNFRFQNPTIIESSAGQIKEFPIVMTSLMGRQLAFSGGGYFRFFPKSFILNQALHRSYNIFYFHILDFVKERLNISDAEYESYFREKATFFARTKRNIKSNLGKGGAWKKFLSLLSALQFCSLEEAARTINWDKTPKITLI